MAARFSKVRYFLKLEATGAWRAFWRPCWIFTLGIALLVVARGLTEGIRVSPSSELPMQIIAYALIGLYYGAFGGLTVGLFALLWRLFGPTLLVVGILSPLLAFLVLWLFRGMLSATANDFLHTVLASASAKGLPHTVAAAKGLKVGCSGVSVLPLIAVLLAPFLLQDLVLILAEGDVLWTFLRFVTVAGTALVTAVLAALLLASPILLFALVRRTRRRLGHVEARQ